MINMPTTQDPQWLDLRERSVLRHAGLAVGDGLMIFAAYWASHIGHAPIAVGVIASVLAGVVALITHGAHSGRLIRHDAESDPERLFDHSARATLEK
jgi:hypothetical protein